MDYSILIGANHVTRTFGQPEGTRRACAICKASPEQDCIPNVRDMYYFDALIRADRDDSVLLDAPERYRWLWQNSRCFRYDLPEQRERFMRAERSIVKHASHNFQRLDEETPDDPSFYYCRACGSFATEAGAAEHCNHCLED